MCVIKVKKEMLRKQQVKITPVYRWTTNCNCPGKRLRLTNWKCCTYMLLTYSEQGLDFEALVLNKCSKQILKYLLALASLQLVRILSSGRSRPSLQSADTGKEPCVVLEMNGMPVWKKPDHFRIVRQRNGRSGLPVRKDKIALRACVS